MRCRSLLQPVVLLSALTVSLSAAPKWSAILKQPDAWYGSAEARSIATNVLMYQTESGGWPKNADMSVPPSAEFLASDKQDVRAPTIDNGATTTPMELLARVYAATPDEVLRAALDHAVDYLLAAQYPNGGWPQYYPLHRGYYTHITYNDNAMINVLELLRAIEREETPWTFVDASRRERATAAVARGIDCILKTQVRVDGQLTVWCAQHDENTFAPAPARKFEPVSLSGAESVGIVRFLMGVEDPSPEVIAAVEAAAAWFQTVRITDHTVERPAIEVDGEVEHDRVLVSAPGDPGVWARFYEIGTNRPIFAGRDTIIHYSLTEVEPERRAGYSYYGTWPATLVDKYYPRWRAKLAKAHKSS